MSTCVKRNCSRRTFMDTDYCFDHDSPLSPVAKVTFALWFLFCGAVSLAVVAVLIWAVIELVTWVTSR